MNGRNGAIISLDISGAFDHASWSVILANLIGHRVPDNLVQIMKDYFKSRTAALELSSSRVTKTMTGGCPQGSACGPGLWNILFDSVLKLKLPYGCQLIAFADDLLLLAESFDATSLQRSVNFSLETIRVTGLDLKLEFNELKTQLMLVGSSLNAITVDIRMGSTKLVPVKSLKYLGVTIDQKLLWNEHLASIQRKSYIIFRNMCRLTKNTWGLHSGICDEIYKGVIEPIIFYASDIWGYDILNKATAKHCLNYKIQRPFLLRICKAYRSVSLEALCIVANIPPAHLELWKQLQIRHCKETRILVHNDENISIIKPCDRMLHPASIREVKIEEEINSDGSLEVSNCGVQCFTDGSKTENGVDCAFVIYENGNEIYNRTYQLPRYCSVYQAELVAMERALFHLAQHHQGKVINLHTDSLSGLQSIKNPLNKCETVANIQRIILTMERRPTMSWIRAHVGFEGNERADVLAKLGVTSGQPYYVRAPLSFAKNIIHKEMTRMWNEEWLKAVNGNWTRQIFPTVAHRIEAKYLTPNFVTTQFITNHGKFGKYLQKRRIRRHDFCQCGDSQDADHLIKNCPAFIARRTYFGINLDILPLRKLFTQPDSATSISEFFSYIHKTLNIWELQMTPTPSESESARE